MCSLKIEHFCGKKAQGAIRHAAGESRPLYQWQKILNRFRGSDFWSSNTKSHFGLSKWLREHALWQPMPGRQ
jgi:hypothetical protein